MLFAGIDGKGMSHQVISPADFSSILDDPHHNETRVGLKTLSTATSLRELRVLSFAECKVDVYTIKREDNGGYAGHIFNREIVFPDFEACQELIGTLYQ